MKKDKVADRLMAHFNPGMAAEELAKSKGVQLAPKDPPTPTPAPAKVPDTWFARNMPGVAQLLADVKAQLPPAIWRDAIAGLKKGQGYAVDIERGLAIGSPPAAEWEQGDAKAEREGFTVSRVRRRAKGPAPPAVSQG